MVAAIRKTPAAAPPAPPKGAPAPAVSNKEASVEPRQPVSPSSLLLLAPPPTDTASQGEPTDLPIPGLKPRPWIHGPGDAPAPAVPPAPAPVPPEGEGKGMSLGKKALLVGAVGVAAFGGIIGYVCGRTSTAPEKPEATLSAPALLDGEGNPAPEADRSTPNSLVHGTGTAMAGTAAARALTTGRKPEDPIKDPVQEIRAPALLDAEGAPSPGDQQAAVRTRTASRGGGRRREQQEWKTYNGTFHGETFSFQYPAGWRVTKLYNGFMVSDPQNDKLGVGFYWGNGAGAMSPEGLLQMLANDSGASRWQPTSNVPDAPSQSPIGPVRGTTAEADYVLRGTPSHGRFHASVTVNQGPYASLWYGAVTSASAPADQWEEFGPVLQRVADSFNADLNQGGEAP